MAIGTSEIGAVMNSPTAQAVAAALALILLVLTLLLARVKASREKTVLIVGPCNSGKTALWLQLLQGRQGLGTVASMEPNEAPLDLATFKGPASCRATTVQLVDVPGHPRVRQAFERYASRVCGIIFVVDALDFLPHTAATGEQLYEILTCRQLLCHRKLPLLLAANKADHGAKAHSPDFVRRRLERELDTLSSTRMAHPPAGGNSSGASLARDGQPVTFASLATAGAAQVTVASISATAGDLQPVQDFIRSCVQ